MQYFGQTQKIWKHKPKDKILTSRNIFTASFSFPSFLAHIASLLLMYMRTFVSLPKKRTFITFTEHITISHAVTFFVYPKYMSVNVH